MNHESNYVLANHSVAKTTNISLKCEFISRDTDTNQPSTKKSPYKHSLIPPIVSVAIYGPLLFQLGYSGPCCRIVIVGTFKYLTITEQTSLIILDNSSLFFSVAMLNPNSSEFQIISSAFVDERIVFTPVALWNVCIVSNKKFAFLPKDSSDLYLFVD